MVFRGVIRSLILFSFICGLQGIKFRRTIEAIEIPYYKISMTLGSCKDKIIFSEQRAWPSVYVNRILDIYYNSQFTVSLVEIRLIINDTDYLAVSEHGVGFTKFAATIFFAVNTGVTYFELNIYTCDNTVTQNATSLSPNKDTFESTESTESLLTE